MADQTDGKLTGQARVNEINQQAEDIIAREPWRVADDEKRGEFITWVMEQQTDRQYHGTEKYGIIFQGNPIDQGIEENLDQQFYLYWAKLYVTFVESQRDVFKHLLESVMENGLTKYVATEIQRELTDAPAEPKIKIYNHPSGTFPAEYDSSAVPEDVEDTK